MQRRMADDKLVHISEGSNNALEYRNALFHRVRFPGSLFFSRAMDFRNPGCRWDDLCCYRHRWRMDMGTAGSCRRESRWFDCHVNLRLTPNNNHTIRSNFVLTDPLRLAASPDRSMDDVRLVFNCCHSDRAAVEIDDLFTYH